MDLGNPNSQAVTNNNTVSIQFPGTSLTVFDTFLCTQTIQASIVHSEMMITPVQVVNDNGISKVKKLTQSLHGNKQLCCTCTSFMCRSSPYH